jgi:hypothetical protein
MWSGPAQLTGLSPARLGWADLGPTDSFYFSFLGWVGPDPAIWAGLERVQPTLRC